MLCRLGLLVGLGSLHWAAPLHAQSPTLVETPLFVSGQNGYHTYRIPALVRTTHGTLLAFCEGRKTSSSDAGDIDIVLRRSTNNGVSWEPMQLVTEEGTNAAITIGNPAPVVDETTGHVFLLFCRNNSRVFYTVSTNDGVSWADRAEITSTCKLPDWSWYATGPGHGIQLKRGAQAGRLVVPTDHSASYGWGDHVVYSDDHGATWQLGAIQGPAGGVNPNENLAVELIPPDVGGGSRLYFNSRDQGGSAPGTRAENWSTNGGTTYVGPFTNNTFFVTPVCQGSVLRLRATDEGADTNRILFSSPNDASRVNISIWSSTNEALSWSAPKCVYYGPSAYSDMARTADGNVALLCEKGVSSAYETITAYVFNEAWLDAPAPPAPPAENAVPAFWNFEEKAAGQTCDTSPGAILDTSPAGYTNHLTAQSSFSYIAGAPLYGWGAALHFDGTGGLVLGDYASSNHFDFGATNSFTIEVVFRVASNSTSIAGLVAKDYNTLLPSWWLRLESGKARFLVSDNAVESFVSTTNTVNDGQWHHLAAVRDASDPTNKTLTLWLDGVVNTATADLTTGSLANGQNFNIGRFNASGRNLTGDIDMVRITPAALTNASQFVPKTSTLTLTYTAGPNGSISGTSPQTLDFGASGTPVTAVPDPGYTFFAWSDGLTNNPRTDVNVISNVSVTASFAATNTAAMPTFNPPAGSYLTNTLTVTLSDSTPGAMIHYTTNGVNWSTGSSGLTVGVPVPVTGFNLQAYATAPGYVNSATNSGIYNTVTFPTWTSTAATGSWATPANWLNATVASGTNVTADFSRVSMTQNEIVTLDGAQTIGNLLFGDQSGNSRIWTLNTGSAGPLTLAVSSGTPNISNSVSTTIGAVLAGAQGLTKTGAGTLTLSAANTYTGGTTISSGTLQINNGTGAGAGAIQVDADGALTFSLSSAAIAFANSLTGSGTINQNSSAEIGLTNASTFSGQVNINSSKLAFAGAHSGDGAPRVYVASGATMSVGDGYSGGTLTISELAGAGTVNAQFGAGSGRILNISQSSTTTFSGVIADAPTGTRVLAVTKSGAGTLTLSGANTCTSPTTVSNGTLLVNGSLAAASAVTVAGGTLGGTGTIGGSVTVASGGTLAPGASPGTLTINGALTLNAAALSTFEVDASTPTNDVIVLGSTVAYGGTLNIVPSGAFTNGQSFTLFSGAGATNTGNFTSITNTGNSSVVFGFTNGVLTVQSTASAAPAVTLTMPTNSPTYAAYATVPLAATVVTNGNSISSVDFLTNGVAVAAVVTPPYTANWTLAAPGSYALTARANYGSTNVGSANSASVTINPVVIPTVSAATMNGSGGVLFTINGPEGQPYTVLTTTNVTIPLPTWPTNSSGFFDASGTLKVTNQPPLDDQRFFRVRTP